VKYLHRARGVFALESTLKENKTDDITKSCGSAPGKFISGTSFAAPLTAGVAVNIKAVLKKSDIFNKLSKANQIKLINRILIASQASGSVNGLRAVLMAESWISKGSSDVPATADLGTALDDSQKTFCSKKAPECLNQDVCGEFSKCLLNSRKVRSVCKNTSKDTLKDLLLSLASTENLEAASGVLRENPTKDASVSKQLWNGYVDRWKTGQYSEPTNLKFGLDYDSAMEVLLPYFSDETDLEALKNALKTLHQSEDFTKRLNLTSEKGGDDYFNSYLKLLKLAKDKLGADAVKTILAKRTIQLRFHNPKLPIRLRKPWY
jgi:hypothetical protein